MLNVQEVNRVIRNVALSIPGEYYATNKNISINIKRLYFQLTGVKMSSEQANYIDNKLGNTRAIAVYKHLKSLFA